MKIIVQSPHFRTSKKLVQAIQYQLQNLEKYSDKIIHCEVVLKKIKDKEQNNCILEVKLLLPGKSLFAMETSTTFKNALDSIMETLLRQLAKYKTKTGPRRSKIGVE